MMLPTGFLNKFLKPENESFVPAAMDMYRSGQVKFMDPAGWSISSNAVVAMVCSNRYIKLNKIDRWLVFYYYDFGSQI